MIIKIQAVIEIVETPIDPETDYLEARQKEYDHAMLCKELLRE